MKSDKLQLRANKGDAIDAASSTAHRFLHSGHCPLSLNHGQKHFSIRYKKNVHKKALNSVNSKRFGNNPFISRMFQPLGQNQTFTVHARQMMHMLLETCARATQPQKPHWESVRPVFDFPYKLVPPITLLLSILLR